MTVQMFSVATVMSVVVGWQATTARAQVVDPPASEQLVAEMTSQIQEGIRQRNIGEAFDRYQAYAAMLLDDSAGHLTWYDKTGNGRLSWIDGLLRRPIESFAEGERFTRQLHAMASDRQAGLASVLAEARQRLDVRPPPPPSRAKLASDASGERTRHEGAASTRPSTAPVTDRAELAPAVNQLIDALLASRTARDAAIHPLTRQQRQSLEKHLYAVTTADAQSGGRLADYAIGRTICDLLERLDRDALHKAAEALQTVAAPAYLDSLADALEVEKTGQTSVATQAGRIVFGTDGPDVYELEQMRDVVAVIDPGGNDIYVDGAVGPARPVLVVIDFAGDDTYRGTAPGIQGGAVLGISMLIDRAGNDTYEAQDIAQGSCVGGVGILIDEAGNDSYRARKRGQGSAFAGVGILLDRGDGNDRYHGAIWCQGFGGMLGIGLLDDQSGNDTYFAGGLLPDGYPDTPGYESWSQGVGTGPRGIANGGIGVLLDGAGDDGYEADYFSHGGGYWFAAGFVRDFGGNDVRHGATRTTYDGLPRPVEKPEAGDVEPRFLRYGQGFGCHYGVGFIFDDAGNDIYGHGKEIVAQGVSWDISVGGLIDFAGDDHYLGTGGYTQGVADQAGMAVLFDAAGTDRYAGQTPGRATAEVDYHPMPQAGGSFSFLIDAAGQDEYASGLSNGTEHQQKSANGFLIDR